MYSQQKFNTPSAYYYYYYYYWSRGALAAYCGHAALHSLIPRSGDNLCPELQLLVAELEDAGYVRSICLALDMCKVYVYPWICLALSR